MDSELNLTNLEKIYWPEEGYTKGDLIDYYTKMSAYILPYLKDRPIMLRRFPNGIDGKSFYQKNINFAHPEWIKTVPVTAEERVLNFLLINDLRSFFF